MCKREFPNYEFDEEFSGCGHDARMSNAFSVSQCTVHPTLTTEDKDAISSHLNVSYVLSPQLRAEQAIIEARNSLKLVERSFEIGAKAVKGESSGLTHGKQAWKKFSTETEDSSLFYSWVRRPLEHEGILYSCGNHLLGQPDIEIEGEEVSTALDLIDIFAMYLFVDKPGDRLRTGGTFQVAYDTPLYRITSSSCNRYEDDDLFYNPYGYWRLKQCDL